MEAHGAQGSSLTELVFRPIGRRTALKAGAVAAAATAFTIGGAATQARADVRGLQILFETPNAEGSGRLLDVRMRTDAMTLFDPTVRVILPDGYYQNPNRRYPVLLLLHGGNPDGVNPANRFPGTFRDWTRRGGTAEWDTINKDVIIVCPDGGNGGFYANWKAPSNAKVNWEEFHIPQLMNWVDQRFRTIVGWKTKAVAGLSMGGFGAMNYAARNPALFVSASAYSGPTDTFDANVQLVTFAAPAADGQPLGAIFGGDQALMHEYNPIDKVEGLRGLRLFMSSGDGAGGNPGSYLNESTVRRTNDFFKSVLDGKGIGVDYRYLPGGQHDWNNWNTFFRQDIGGILAALPHQ